jgi:hypothetical protein
MQSSMGGAEMRVGPGETARQAEILFTLAKQELGSMSDHLRRRPPDEAAALAVLASSLQKMCDGLKEVAKVLRQTNE